jgi:hypothetical protein
MASRPSLLFVCAHLTDQRLYAAQVAALASAYDCAVLAFRDTTAAICRRSSSRRRSNRVLAGWLRATERSA